MKIGVLALQGGFAAHQAHLQQLNVAHCQVRKPEQLMGCDGLIIPGGESSTLLKLMAPFDWVAALQAFAASGKPIFGTCAGMILLAKAVQPQQASLSLIDIAVERNAYGRQLNSFIENISVNSEWFGVDHLEAVFIRAPKILTTGDDVKVLITHQQQPVMVQQGHILVASFHPELSDDLTVHRYFIRCCENTRNVDYGHLCLS